MQGWCATRNPGVDADVEPTATAGWGFCSSDKSQAMCEKSVPGIVDPSAFEVNLLDEAFCVEKLADNLRVEQPDARRSEFQELRSQRKLICVGRNRTRVFSGDVFYVARKDGTFSRVADKADLENYVVIVNHHFPEAEFYNCEVFLEGLFGSEFPVGFPAHDQRRPKLLR